MTQAKPSAPAPAACPICRRASQARYRPFCSRRCADVDLARWLRGSYAIPGEPENDTSGKAEEASQPPKADKR
jgi:endogenous inhibitor of DNA gyrase (YacG/DUF329 family)